jgi:hypothetical protein
LLQLAPTARMTGSTIFNGAHLVTPPLGQAGRLEQRFLLPPPSIIQSDFKF